MRKSVAVIMLAGVIMAATVYVWRDELLLYGMEFVAARAMAAPLLADLPEGLHVILCGAGTPMPDPKRSGPCVAVVAGETVLVVDAGSGAARNLADFGIPADRISAVLLTHFHSDHIDGLGELMMQRWAMGEQHAPTPVFGPEGVEDVVTGFNLAYSRDRESRIAHHGADMMRPGAAGGDAQSFQVPEAGILTPVLEVDGLRIRSFLVDHGPVKPAVGYRFDYKGRSLVISGDTVRSENLEALNVGIDLLLHEALNVEMVNAINAAAVRSGQKRLEKITRDVLSYHASPVDAAKSAAAVQARHLLFVHIAPPLPYAFMNPLFVRGVRDVYSGSYTVGEDGTMVSLDAGTTEVRVRNLPRLM